jgi:hypothetical protein
MPTLSATVVIEDEVDTDVDHSHPSWKGYVIVRVCEGVRVPITLYIAEDKARDLAEQLTAALAVTAGS